MRVKAFRETFKLEVGWVGEPFFSYAWTTIVLAYVLYTTLGSPVLFKVYKKPPTPLATTCCRYLHHPLKVVCMPAKLRSDANNYEELVESAPATDLTDSPERVP